MTLYDSRGYQVIWNTCEVARKGKRSIKGSTSMDLSQFGSSLYKWSESVAKHVESKLRGGPPMNIIVETYLSINMLNALIL